MPWHGDDEQQLVKLLARGTTGTAYQSFNNLRMDIFSRNHKDFLLLIDDYQGTFNSFVFVQIQDNLAIISDFFISDQSFLPPDKMKKKYLGLIKKYLSDLGYKDIKLKGEIKA